ncbi:MAG: Ig-like domain-containing protein [Candidatus Sericytochromatia bacterium]|nr:Ig-like domain-containing protein [Candidatus Sericytochromatia bacterium]
MTKQRLFSTGLGLAATLSMVACGPATNTPTTPSSPNASPTAVVSATPAPVGTPTPDASPTAVGSATPTPDVSPSAAVSPTPVPATTPTPAATNTPLPAATSDISVIEKTTFNGKIFDDTNSPLDGVTVKVKSLNSSVPFEAETVTAGGTYAFNNAPSGVQVEIVSSKAGFTTRKRVEVLKSNKQGDPNANRYDFGTDGGAATFSAAYNALSDKPEVVMVTPSRNASGIDPKTSFVLKFSEPMDKKTAEDTFTVRSFNSRKMTVDAGNLRVAGGANTLTGNGLIATNFVGANSSKVWDKDAFNISWNSDDTEVTFSFKEEKLLPTDKDSNLVPDYNVAFNGFNSNDRLLKDKSGISRSEKHFKLTDGDFEESYKFSIKTDEVKPTITGITAETNENGGQNGDSVRVRYSERMIIYTRDISIAGGMENVAGADQKAPGGYPSGTVATTNAAAANYNVTTVQTGGVTTFTGTWGSLGGTAVYDTTDLTHKTVLLLPPTQDTLSSTVAAPPGSNQFQAPGMTFLLADGTTTTPTASNTNANGGKYFRNTTFGSTLSTTGVNTTESGAFACDAQAAANPITMDFFYTDGTATKGIASGNIANAATAADIQTALNAVATTSANAWTVTSSTGGGAVCGANNDTLTVTLAANAQHAGKNISTAIIRKTGAFDPARLGGTDNNSMHTAGYVVFPGATAPAESLSSLFRTGTANFANGGLTASVDFFYTNGTFESGVATAALTANTGAEVVAKLNALVTTANAFNIAIAGNGDDVFDANERFHIGIVNRPVRAGKTIGLVRINNTAGTAFDSTVTSKLISGTGWVLPNEYDQVQHILNNYLLSTGGLFTVTETAAVGAGKTAGVFNAGDTFTFSLGVNAKNAAGTNVMKVTIPQGAASTGFATNAINAPTAGFVVYPNAAVGGRFDLYKPGDTVRVKVSSTVLDPAGNTLDSSRDNASANAS